MSRDMTRVAVWGAISLLLPVFAGAVFQWDAWITPVVVIVLLGVTALATREQWRQASHPPRVEEPEPVFRPLPPPVEPPPPPPPAARVVTSVGLASSVEGIPFTFGCTVQWQGLGHAAVHTDPEALAVQAVLDRARQVTARHHPEDSGTVHALTAALGHVAPDATRAVTAWASSITLTIGDEYRSYVQELAALRRQQQLDRLHIDHERTVRSYLSDDVLTSVGSTVVWWLAKDQTKVRETVDLIGALAHLSATANNAEPDLRYRHDHRPEPIATPIIINGSENGNGHHPVAGSDLLPDPDDNENALFGVNQANLLERHGFTDLADETRKRYGVEDWGNPGDEPGEDPRPQD